MILAMVSLLGGAGALGGQEVSDSLAHPIATNCGERLDPVGFVLGRAEELGLTADEEAALSGLADRVARENRPLGQRFWAARGSGGPEERRAVLFELRANYRAALREVRGLLGEDRFARAFDPAGVPEDRGMVRCLARAIPAVVGVGPR